MARGTDYTYTLARTEHPIIERGALSLGIYIPNDSPTAQSFTLTKVRGEPFGINVRERLIARRQKPVSTPTGRARSSTLLT